VRPDRCLPPRLSHLVLGQFEVVAADRFDAAGDGVAVRELDPDRLASPGELAEGECEVVTVCAGAWSGSWPGDKARELAWARTRCCPPSGSCRTKKVRIAALMWP
jgi:hypothetical protein